MESEKDKEARMRRLEAEVRAAEKAHACDPTAIFNSPDEEREFWQWFNANTHRLEGALMLAEKLKKDNDFSMSSVKKSLVQLMVEINGTEEV